MMRLKVPLNPSLAAYVAEQAAADCMSPIRYVKKLIQQQKMRDQALMRAFTENDISMDKFSPTVAKNSAQL